MNTEAILEELVGDVESELVEMGNHLDANMREALKQQIAYRAVLLAPAIGGPGTKALLERATRNAALLIGIQTTKEARFQHGKVVGILQTGIKTLATMIGGPIAGQVAGMAAGSFLQSPGGFQMGGAVQTGSGPGHV